MATSQYTRGDGITITCQHCGKQWSVPPSWTSKKFCSKSCHYAHRKGQQNPVPTLIGQRFGRLVVSERAPSKSKNSCWLCRCDCGKETIVGRPGLMQGTTISCGCAHEHVNLRHGLTETVEHVAFCAMWGRCTNPNNEKYPIYGGRGITVCERWKVFENFLADMGTKPSPKHSLDRIDGNGNYEPSNCRWADAKTQANNLRCNRIIEFNGKRQTLQQWADELGMDKSTIANRINSGWPLDKALSAKRYTKAYQTPNSKLTENDVKDIRWAYAAGKVSYAQLAQRFHVSQSTISQVVRGQTWPHIR